MGAMRRFRELGIGHWALSIGQLGIGHDSTRITTDVRPATLCIQVQHKWLLRDAEQTRW